VPLLLERTTDGRLLGSFTSYAARFVSPSYAGSLAYNYWLNDAVSLAGDLLAAQLVVRFWLDPGSWAEQHAWMLSLAFWTFLVGVNAASVRAYGEMGAHDLLDGRPMRLNISPEYWLSSLKVITIVVFILVGVAVNAGLNPEHKFVGFNNWRIPGAPFVGGFGGFAKVFVTASFACEIFTSSKRRVCTYGNCRRRHREPRDHGRRDEKSK
jgi:AAT family amino acid transporter